MAYFKNADNEDVVLHPGQLIWVDPGLDQRNYKAQVISVWPEDNEVTVIDLGRTYARTINVVDVMIDPVVDEVEQVEPTYTIVRRYLDPTVPRRVISTGVTLEQAQEHCTHPETSSRTATNVAGVEHTRTNGDWFDGYQEES